MLQFIKQCYTSHCMLFFRDFRNGSAAARLGQRNRLAQSCIVSDTKK